MNAPPRSRVSRPPLAWASPLLLIGLIHFGATLSLQAQSLHGINKEAGEKGTRVDPETPSDPLGILTGAKNEKAMWKKMVEFVPEYPEFAVVGTWVSVPEADAREFVPAMRLHALEAAAAAEDQPLPPQMKQMVLANSKLDQKMIHSYSATFTFSADGTLTGTYRGPNYDAPRDIKTKWRFDGIQTIKLNPSPTIKKLVFAAKGHLFFHDHEGSGILLVLKKKE